MLSVEGEGKEWSVICDGGEWALETNLPPGARIVEESSPSLEDIFVARIGASRHSMREM